MGLEFETTRVIEFSETDMAGIVHFSNFFRWMETVEIQFLDSIGVPVVKKEGDVFYGWPRRKASFDFKIPVRFGDVVRLKLAVKEIRIRSVRYGVTVRLDQLGAPLAARGEMTTVWTRINPNNGKIESVQFPEGMIEKLSGD
jgi:acyl-CoA thioester hydrolase